MRDIEIPLGKRKAGYRFFEMVPALVSYGAIILLIVLSLINPTMAAIYLLIVILTALVKAIGIAYHTTVGRDRLEKAQRTDWHLRLKHLENPEEYLEYHESGPSFALADHIDNLKDIIDQPELYPKPSQIYNAVIIAIYNESYDVLQPTVQALANSTYDKDHMVVAIAYEERGGPEVEKTAQRIAKEYAKTFRAIEIVKHPDNMPNEVRGKGGNITYAGQYLRDWLKVERIAYSNVIVTTLDCDNRPHETYFDYVAYEYIIHPDRKNLSFQPISLFMNNIWDVPAPMRVVATGNSFWNIISSVRPHVIRNFASHSQPMDALVEMNFWSTRTIVEDGHQYWRSYFHFDGRYGVVPVFVPIYQDAVLSSTYVRTLKAQFFQLRRWAYGASDVPYVATRIFSSKRNVPLGPALARLIRLLDGHVTLASIAILIAIGGWIPLFVSMEATQSIAAQQLPEIVSRIQQVALIGLFITVFFTFKLLPPRPERYKRHRNIFMLAQWLLMPFTAIVYSSASAFTSQTALLLGKYFDKFDVTEKATVRDKKQQKTDDK